MLAALMPLYIQPVAAAQETADTVAAREQEPSLFKRIIDRISKPHGYFDDRYVREPQRKLHVTQTGYVQQTGVRINNLTDFETDWDISTCP